MILCLAAAALVSSGPSAAANIDTLERELHGIASAFHGTLGYSFHHLKRNERLELRADEPFPTASTIKLAVMCAAFDKQQRGELGYYDTRVLEPQDKRTGSGFLQNYKDGTKLELKELLHLMITVSDNTATVMLVKWLGAMEIDRWLEAHGLKTTRILIQLPERETELRKPNEKWGLGVTTPAEMRSLIEMIGDGRAGTPAACDEMQRILSHQYFDDGVPSQIPPSVCVQTKTGALDRSRSEVALVHSPSGDYALAVYTQENQDTHWGYDNEGLVAIRAISRAIWKHYHPKDKYAPPAGVDKF